MTSQNAGTEPETHDEPTIECLEQTWSSVTELAATIDDKGWATPTDLPGWTVKDCLSHMVGVESSLLGEPQPEVEVEHLPHVNGAFPAMIEKPVEARRPVPAADVLAEFGDCTRRRLEVLRAMTHEEWEAPSWSPVGEGPYRQFMEVRVFDCWMHEQDMRRALDAPGHLEGPAPELALGRLRAAMGFVVGKKAGAPQGSTVVFDITGPVGDRFAIEVSDRARETAEMPAEPTVSLSMDLGVFAALGGGRWSADQARDSSRVTISGDAALGETILANMGFTP